MQFETHLSMTKLIFVLVSESNFNLDVVRNTFANDETDIGAEVDKLGSNFNLDVDRDLICP